MDGPQLCDRLPPLSPEEQRAAVARRAYEKWVNRGCPSGTALQDWVDAEAEVATEMNDNENNEAFGWPHLGSTVR
jgi:hypothetical protein